MNEWKEVKLGDVCSYVSDRTPNQRLNLSNYISTENMLPGKCGITTPSGLPTTNVIEYISGDTLVSNIRPYFKKIWYADRSGGCSTDVLNFRSNSLYNSKFLYYVLSNDKFFEYSMSTSKGTKMPRGDKKSLMNYTVPLPPLPEQKAIADTLSCIDDKIELNNKINKNLEAQAQAIFKSWFVDFEPFQDGEFVDSELGRIPKGWRVGTLGEVANFQNGYAFKSKELLIADTANCYDVFKMGHIKKGGGFYADGTKSWIFNEHCKGLDKYVLKKGDLLMCMTDMKGNVALLGHTALMNVDNKYIVNQRVGLLRPNKQHNIGFPYLYLLTNNDEFIENLRNRANSGVQVNLSSNEIKSSKLFIPPNDLNAKFNEISMLLFETIFKNENEIQILTALRDTLLPKLMSGEIRVPPSQSIGD